MIRFALQVLGLALVVAGAASVAMAAPPPPGVPEIDAGSMASALAMAAGGVALLSDRLRRRKK